MRDRRFPNVLLADFVTKGDRGKYTLVNVFTGDIVVEEFPARLRLGVYIEYRPDTNLEHSLTFDIHMNGESLATLNGQVSDMIVGAPVVIIQNFGAGFDRPVTLGVTAKVADEKPKEILSKRVLQIEQDLPLHQQAKQSASREP